MWAKPWIHSPTEGKQKDRSLNFNTSSLTQQSQSLHLLSSTNIYLLPHPSRLSSNFPYKQIIPEFLDTITHSFSILLPSMQIYPYSLTSTNIYENLPLQSHCSTLVLMMSRADPAFHVWLEAVMMP